MPSHPNHRPVFYDESRKRWSWVVRLLAASGFVAVIGLTVFVVSILAIPLLPHSVLPRSRELGDSGKAEPAMNAKQRARRHFAQGRDKRRLAEEVARQRAAVRRAAAGRRQTAAVPGAAGPPIVAAFYVNWEETSRASLRRHVDEITHLFPEWLHLTKDGKSFHDSRNVEDKTDIEPFVREHQIPILPILSNYVPVKPGSEQGIWSGAPVHTLVSNNQLRASFIHELKQYLLQHKWQGINIDFEQVDISDKDGLTWFMEELQRSFHPAGLLVTQDIEMDNDALDVEKLALWNDYIIPMVYDQHSPGDPGGPGSIAGISWTKDYLNQLMSMVPASKVILGLGGYAYDWKVSDPLHAANLTYQSAVIQAKESADPSDPSVARIKIDPTSINPYYHYFDEKGAEHVVWMLDATTTFNQWQVARPFAPRGIALWMLGSEDPGVWDVIGRHHITSDASAAIDGGVLNSITYGRQAQVDFEGEGELLEVLAEPSDGSRTVYRDRTSGLITRENYESYPSAYVVRRYGYEPKKIVLTFDDGPDPQWTPQVLDILKREGVKASFFVIGKLAEENPDILGRIWADGHEIGNHTYDHPNLALSRPSVTKLEISLTERVIEAVTGHATTLFRPPYAIDVEPRTGGELKPIMVANQENFITVGEKNDPQDWSLFKKGPNGENLRRTSDDIVRSVLANKDEGNVILLHDGGGDRSTTIAALPLIIQKLKSDGYQFISIAELRGVSREVMFPALKGREEVLVGVDKWVFELSYLVQRMLATLFALSVLLGVSRQGWMTVLALIQRRQEKIRDLAAGAVIGFHPKVSVVIAAFNEEKVIERTVRSILASDYPELEVIVVDDGSADGTKDVVDAAFEGNARVRSIGKENGGKASALNRGMEISSGEIVVALDADTLFAPDAISRMVRHFSDPKVGAVSGSVHVGNAHNVLTRWQALEYITSQNFDRRAYDLLNCITVVPGAIGAWRRSAIEQVGSYTSETLAEDTDLTWKIRRAGWRILNDSSAHAFTEAPESLGNLARQRFRWAFGTLQNLFKHRDATFRHGAFGWIALPSLWLYQILFPAISPIMDVTVVFALVTGHAAQVLMFYGLMVGAECVGAAIALWMEKGKWGLLPWIFFQRFLYRQLMYYVILKSLVAAIRGGAVGWNKFERTGTATAGVVKPGV
jgi:cellulose synthase/poly-beta-1,6-N-acetylglucosamine synthase-like glycosyltransferase/peptidoglycan/xylan/chitin deacetylase (PgdA/CDA1 family)/spore germination protein YaaH